MSKNVPIGGMSLCVMSILFFTLAHVPLAGQEKKPAKELKYMEVDLGGGVKMKLVHIEPGKFTMGSPKSEQDYIRKEFGADYAAEEKQHEVEITTPFYMGVFTVTQQEYERVMGKNPSYFCAAGPGKDQVAGLDTARSPVENVSWNEATEFCNKLNKMIGNKFDLPTEAEWEYACRAGTKGPFHFGDSLSSKQANFNGDHPYGAAKAVDLKMTAKVGSYEANAFGLFDMHGNVWQWCKDYYNEDYYKDSPVRDPQGPANGMKRVLRGGSWSYSAWGSRSAFRGSQLPVARADAFGFRVVLRLSVSGLSEPKKLDEPKKVEVDVYLPNDADTVVTLDMKQLLSAPAVNKHLDTLVSRHGIDILFLMAAGNRDWEQGLRDNRKQITELLNSPENVENLRSLLHDTLSQFVIAGNAQAKNDEAFLGVLTGEWKQRSAEAFLMLAVLGAPEENRVMKVAGKNIYQLGKGQRERIFVALPADGVLLASPLRKYVEEAIEQASGKRQPQLAPALKNGLKKRNLDQTLFIIVQEPLQKRIIEGGLIIGANIKAELSVSVFGQADERQVVADTRDGLGQLRMLVTNNVNQPHTRDTLLGILKGAQLVAENGRVRVRVEVSSRQIEELVRPNQ